MTVFDYVKKNAEKGDIESQYNLGYCYEHGLGTEQSYTNAIMWYRVAAYQGNAEAQLALYYCYKDGNGVEQSNDEAVEWLHEAAKERKVEAGNVKEEKTEAGNVEAQYQLGMLYSLGQLGESSYYDSFLRRSVHRDEEWWRKAAEQGHSEAQYCLGKYYSKEKQYVEAVKWYCKAAGQGNKSAKEALEKLLKIDPDEVYFV